MKTKHVILGCVSFVALSACTDKKETTIHESTTIEKDTIVIQEQQKPGEPIIIEKTSENTDNGTSLNIDKDGVEFSTKSGDNSTEIELKDKK